MHNTISYAHLPEDQKKREALKDIREWLGTRKYNQLVKEFRWHKPMPLEQFTGLCSIAGIQGYPVKVWYEEIWPPT